MIWWLVGWVIFNLSSVQFHFLSYYNDWFYGSFNVLKTYALCSFFRNWRNQNLQGNFFYLFKIFLYTNFPIYLFILQGLCLSGCEDEESNQLLKSSLSEKYPNMAKHIFVASDTVGSIATACQDGIVYKFICSINKF